MFEIIRNRTIRPSTRLKTSINYRVDVKIVDKRDILIVNISHESKSFLKTFKFAGKDVARKSTISFRVKDNGKKIDIIWSGAQPIKR